MARLSENNSFESSSDYFESYVDDMVGIINLKGDVFKMTTDLSLKETYFSRIKLAYHLPEIKVLLILSGTSALGEEKLDQFIRSITESADGKLKLVREENALFDFIRLIYSSNKIVVLGVRGSVIGAFLGAILAADHRVASENTLFSFPSAKQELLSLRALTFFLRQYVGIVKTKNILFGGDSIPASKALELGLVYDVVA